MLTKFHFIIFRKIWIIISNFKSIQFLNILPNFVQNVKKYKMLFYSIHRRNFKRDMKVNNFDTLYTLDNYFLGLDCRQPVTINAHLLSCDFNTAAGSRVYYECDTGFSLGHYNDISFSIQCQDNGTWTNIPQCG